MEDLSWPELRGGGLLGERPASECEVVIVPMVMMPQAPSGRKVISTREREPSVMHLSEWASGSTRMSPSVPLSQRG